MTTFSMMFTMQNFYTHSIFNMKLNYFFAAVVALAYGSSLVLAIPIQREFEARDFDNDDLITREVVDFEAREFPVVDIDTREFNNDEDLELREFEDLEDREFEDIAERSPQVGLLTSSRCSSG